MLPNRQTRFLSILIALCALWAAGPVTSRAQDEVKNLITLNVKEKPVGDVLKMIEASSGYIFFYNTADFDKNRIVSIECKNADLSSVLTK